MAGKWRWAPASSPTSRVPPGEALPVAYCEALRHVLTVATDGELLYEARED